MPAQKGTIRTFYGDFGGKRLSATGCRCDMECPHCMGVLLEGSADVSGRGMLSEACSVLRENGCGSVLITGGRDRNGAVPIEYYADAIAGAVSEGFEAVVRPGLVSEDIIARLIKFGVRYFSLDIHQDQEVIGCVLGMKRSVSDYSEILDAVLRNGGTVIPRITLGFGMIDFRFCMDLLISRGVKKVVLDTIVPDGRTCVDESVVTADTYLQCARELKDAGLEVCIGCRRDPGMGDICIAAAETGILNIEDIDARTEAELTASGYRIERMGSHFGVK